MSHNSYRIESSFYVLFVKLGWWGWGGITITEKQRGRIVRCHSRYNFAPTKNNHFLWMVLRWKNVPQVVRCKHRYLDGEYATNNLAKPGVSFQTVRFSQTKDQGQGNLNLYFVLNFISLSPTYST